MFALCKFGLVEFSLNGLLRHYSYQLFGSFLMSKGELGIYLAGVTI